MIQFSAWSIPPNAIGGKQAFTVLLHHAEFPLSAERAIHLVSPQKARPTPRSPVCDGVQARSAMTLADNSLLTLEP